MKNLALAVACVTFPVAALTENIPVGDFGDMQEVAYSGGAVTSDICLPDDIALNIGNTCAAPDYWWEYNSTGTQLELWSTNVAGPGTDGVLVSWDDGDDVADFTDGLTCGGVILGPDGAVGAPTYSFSSEATSGFYYVGANDIGLSIGGAQSVDYQAGVINVTNANGIYAINSDVQLTRDAADTLAMRRSTNAQESRIYGTYTDASNHERVELGHSGSVAYLDSTSAGTGTTTGIEFQLDGSASWAIDTSGNLLGGGSVRAGAASDIYWTGSTEVDTGATPADGNFRITNAAETQGICIDSGAASATIYSPADCSSAADLNVSGDVNITDQILVKGAGPHTFGKTSHALPNAQYYLAGDYTSTGANVWAAKMFIYEDITGFSGDTTAITGIYAAATTKTQSVAELIGVMSQMYVAEPSITLNGGATCTDGAAIVVSGAPTECTNNAGIIVQAGGIINRGTNEVHGPNAKGANTITTTATEAVTFPGGGGAASAVTVGSLIPDGSYLLGVTTRVTTADNGGACTGYNVGDGATADLYGVATTETQGTTTTPASQTADFGHVQWDGPHEVTITGVGGNCIDMVVDITVHLMTFTAETSN